MCDFILNKICLTDLSKFVELKKVAVIEIISSV